VTPAAAPAALEGVLETVHYHEPGEAEAMLDLYRDLLGLPVVAEWEDGTALRVGSGLILLFDREALARRSGPIAEHGTSGPSHLALLASPESYEGWREGVSAAGLEIVHEQQWSAGRRSFYFRDPAGNLIEIAGGDIWPAAPARPGDGG
jgi:catechol 2,3-dioxygenase-like lactoylglutathione lyase family enzyme